jgi:hypothetical protein
LVSNADPDRAFISGSQTNADPDPDPDQTFESQKVKFLHEKFTLSRFKIKKHTYDYEGTKAFLGRKPGLFVNFGRFPCSWVRIRISNWDTDPDRREPNECRSRWIRIRIYNTAFYSRFLAIFLSGFASLSVLA